MEYWVATDIDHKPVVLVDMRHRESKITNNRGGTGCPHKMMPCTHANDVRSEIMKHCKRQCLIVFKNRKGQFKKQQKTDL